MLHSNVYKLTAAASNNMNGVQNQVKLTCAFRSQDTPWGVGTGVEQIRGFWDAGMVFPLFFGKKLWVLATWVSGAYFNKSCCCCCFSSVCLFFKLQKKDRLGECCSWMRDFAGDP